MAFCSKCGQELRNGAKYCDSCGAPTDRKPANSERREAYEGVIHKCPNCGEVLGSFVRNCPSCGYELREVKSQSAVKEFSRKLEAIEARREYESPKAARMARNDGHISKTDEQKISLIQSFAVPNTKEDMLEFMILATSSINYRAFDRYHGIPTKGEQLLNDAWLSKVEQIHEKAKLSYGSEADYRQIEELYERCLSSIQKNKKKGKTRGVRFWIVWLCVMGFCFAAIYFGGQLTLKNEIKKIESVKQEAAEAVNNGDYKKALLVVESLNTEELSEENRRSWKIDQEILIEEIIEEAEEHGVHLERTQENGPSSDDSG